MYKNNLIGVLTAFSTKEMTRYMEFAGSPYFNKHKKIKQLIEYLRGIYPNFNDKNCHREQIWQILEPNKPFDKAQLAILFTYATRLLEDFLIQEQFKSNRGYQHILLMQNLRQKRQYKHYERILKQQLKALDKQSHRDSNFYNLNFLTATEKDQYHSQTEGYKKDLSIQEKQQHLDNFYLSEKLRDACEMAVRSKIFKVDYDQRLIELLLQEIELHFEHYSKVPPILLYSHIYKMVTEGEEKVYFETFDLLTQNEASFPLEELRTVYNYFQHACIAKINQGKLKFLRTLFELYQIQLENALLNEDGYLSEWHYKNIITTALRLNETDWVSNFLESYKDQLKPSARENAYRFNLAAFYDATGQYEKVLDLLQTIEYRDLRYNVGAKSLLLRTYYALNEYEALVSFTEAFKKYLLRNKTISDFRRKGYNNLLKFTHKAFRIKTDLDFQSKEKSLNELNKLSKEIADAQTILNKGWLDAKLEEIRLRLGTAR